MEKELINLYEANDIEIYFYDNEVIFVKNDIITYLDPNSLMESIQLIHMMKKVGIGEIERGRVMSRILDLVG